MQNGINLFILKIGHENKTGIIIPVAVSTLIEDGKSGFLHSPQNPEQFAQVLINIFSMNKEKLNEIRQCTFIQWETNFTLEIMFDKLLKVYNSI